MKKIILGVIISIVFIVIGGILLLQRSVSPSPKEKIYVAVEGDGKIAVIDAATRKIIKNIDLSLEHEGGRLIYAPHNVQVAPDGKSVWVTANVGKHEGHSAYVPFRAYAHGNEDTGEMRAELDQVIVIDPVKDEIVERVPVTVGNLAHVALDPKSENAYVTAGKGGYFFRINTKTYKAEAVFRFDAESEPHGLRINPAGRVAYIALLKGKALASLDLSTNQLHKLRLSGQAVQVGVTPDGKFSFASLYDEKKLAIFPEDFVSRIKIKTSEPLENFLRYVVLPKSARGPIQMYPTPDSKFVYLADQGYYFNQPEGEWVYKIDLEAGKVVKEIKAGRAPHGVVVSKDGSYVYVTNLLSGDVSVIDTVTDSEVVRIPVGKEPNGISIWNKNLGGTP
ncbi:MAG: cytochrome D1 domain-containing protein [Patescibacteria group bacterium]